MNTSFRPTVLALLLASCLAVQGATAAEEGHDEAAHLHKHHVALFLGATQAEEHEGDRDDPQFTVGIDYERRLTDLFGVGLLLDLVVEGNREYLVGVPFFLHPWKGTNLHVAPGWHQVKEDGEDGGVLRIGVGWDFEVGKATLTPLVIYDLTEHANLWVLGVAIGKGW